MKTALITGITGQDGAYLAEYLLGNNYKVYGAYRRSSSVDFWRIEDLGIEKNPNFFLVEYDLTDISSAIRLIEKSTPDEIYNLAAQSFVGVSFDQPIVVKNFKDEVFKHIKTICRSPDYNNILEELNLQY